MDQNEILHDPGHLGVPSAASKMISELTVHSAQTMRLSRFKISTISNTDRNKLLFEPFHLRVPSDAFKMISEAMVRLLQTVDLSCTDSNTISKRNETRFYMTHIT
jgi:hypothetical protein